MDTSRRSRAARRRAILAVERMEGRRLPSTFSVINTNDSGAGSLRQAILDADAETTAGTDTINFAIPGTGVQTIRPASALPTITYPVLIDGYTQAGASPNTAASGDNAVLTIQLDGSAAPGGNGLDLSGATSTIRGLAIFGFTSSANSVTGTAVGGNGILVEGSGGDVIEGDYLGLGADGTAHANGLDGVLIQGASNNTIGGATPDARNVISGNSAGGVAIQGFLNSASAVVAPTGNLVAGNEVGTNPAGTAARPNGGDGVAITGGTLNTVGGASAAARNLVSGNAGNGVSLLNAIASGRSTANLVLGNYVGTDAAGTTALGNGLVGGSISGSGPAGIFVGGDANTIGGSAPGDGNLVSGNAGAGISIEGHVSSAVPSTGANNLVQGNLVGTDATGAGNLGNGSSPSGTMTGSVGGAGGITIFGANGNTIGGPVLGQGNTIAFNAGPGVQIGSYSPTMSGDVALSNSIFSNTGPGIGLDARLTPILPVAPVLTSAIPITSPTPLEIVRGTLASVPSTSFLIQLFADTPGATGTAEGRTLVGQAMATTDASGNASFTASTPVLTPGQVLTATATSPVVGTSAFSPSVASSATDLAVTLTGTPGSPTAGQTITYTITATNNGPSPATGVTLTDTLPAGITFVSATQGNYTLATNLLSASLGTLAPGASATITLVVQTATAGSIANVATIAGNEGDPTPANNTATLVTNVLPVGIPDGPRVTSVVFNTPNRKNTYVTLTFNTALDPTRAANLLNYSLAMFRSSGTLGPAIRLRSATYNSSTLSVTVQTAARLGPRKSFQLTVRGATSSGIADTAGNLLDGLGNGKPGSDYVATLSPKLTAQSVGRARGFRVR